jgi:hypothetical protein
MEKVRLSVPAGADQRDARGPVGLSGKTARLNRRQTSRACNSRREKISTLHH